MPKSDKLAVKTTEGRPAQITAEAQQTLESKVATENRLPVLFDQWALETPLVSFVKDEAEAVMPHLFSIGIGGMTTINGAEMDTARLKTAATAMRKHQAKKKAAKGWQTKVHRIQDA